MAEKQDIELIMITINTLKEATLNRIDLMREDIQGIHKRQDIANGRTAKLEINLSNVKENMVSKSDCQAKHLTKELNDAVDWKQKVLDFISKTWWIFVSAFFGFLIANFNK